MTKVGATAAYLKKLFETCSKDKALSFKGPKFDPKTEDYHFYIKCSQCNVGYTLMECESDGATRFPYSFGSFVKAHSHPITTVSADAVFKDVEGEPVFAPTPQNWKMDKALWDKKKKEFKKKTLEAAEALDKANKAKPIQLLPLKVDASVGKEWIKPCDHHWVFFEGKFRCLRCLDTVKSPPAEYVARPEAKQPLKPAPQVVKDPEGRKFR